MTVKGKHRGHDMELTKDGGIWIYSDSKEAVSESQERPCGHCGKSQTKEGHDACLGELPGLMNACCGHGNDEEVYIQLMNGNIISGDNAVLLIEIFKRYNCLESTLKEMNIGRLGIIGIESAGVGARLAAELINKGEKGIIIVAAGNVGKNTITDHAPIIKQVKKQKSDFYKVEYTPIIKEKKPHNDRNVKRNNRKSKW